MPKQNVSNTSIRNINQVLSQWKRKQTKLLVKIQYRHRNIQCVGRKSQIFP